MKKQLRVSNILPTTFLSTGLLSSLLLLPSISSANEPEVQETQESQEAQEDISPWAGNAELGFIQTSGNSDTQSFNGKFNLVHELEPSTTSLKLEALTSEEDGTSSKEKYLAELKYDYALSDRSYVASFLGYEDDRFNGYEYQSTLAVGYGYKAWNDKKKGKLELEVGPGYRRNVLEQRNEDNEKIEQEAVGRASLNLLVNIGEGAKFTEVLSVEGGDSKIVYKSDMGIQSTLVGALAMKINYQVKHTTDVPEGKKNTDSLVGVTLVYSF